MLEMTCTNMTYSEVLKTSGHVDKFADFMVKDLKNGQCHRADKLISDWVDKQLNKKKAPKPEEATSLLKLQADCEEYDKDQLDEAIKANKIKAPETNNDLGPAEAFNMMFECQIGPTGQLKGYLRPETAQGIFLNWRRLIEYNNGKMPCAGATLGMGFRNEINPRQGLLRVREF
jgi:glycyl-tRNA synthetase